MNEPHGDLAHEQSIFNDRLSQRGPLRSPDCTARLLDALEPLRRLGTGGACVARRILRLTYGCGRYVAYEQLVKQAAAHVGLPESAALALEADWLQLTPWSGAIEALQQLQPHCKIAIVTNCSIRLGRQAAGMIPVKWDAVITAEEAGTYKPDPAPYRLALDVLDVTPSEAVFVAGSSYDMFGTASVGLRTYWHNRAALPLVEGAPPPEIEAPTLEALVPWCSRFDVSAHNDLPA